jgi:DNA uptake protein ComE-like DNA-binding protein
MQRRVVGATLFALMAGLAAASGAAESSGKTGMPEGHPPIGKPATPAPAKTDAGKPAKLVDLNSASKAELKTLPGIGDAEAAKIIAARPYLSKAELVSKNVIPEGVYVSLKKLIIAKQPAKPAQKK